MDLSGSIQGAGGIGGLLATSLDGTIALYCHDANGNVGQLIGTDGELLAHYEYSPFGEAIVSTGPLAKANPFRFSTKHWDDLTGLGYWGYRWYSPGLGRWLCRDPINEYTGVVLYLMVKNDPIDCIDILGLLADGYWMAMGTTSIEIGECGEFKWKVWFQIGPVSGAPKGGQVSQHIERTADIYDCKTGVKYHFSPTPKSPANFWEDLLVEKGSDNTWDEWHEPYRDEKRGTVVITGSATFMPGKKHQEGGIGLADGYWPAPEGITKSPYPTMTRTLTVTWDCCCDSKDRNTKLSPMPTVTPGPF